MTEPLRTRSALASLDLAVRTAPASEKAGVSLGQRRFLGKVNLRGDAGDGPLARAVRDALDLELPAANRAEVGEAASLLRVGPDEWLAIGGSLADAWELSQRLSAALEGHHAAATDVSSGWAAIRLGGAESKTVLRKGCTLDLDPPRFQAGHCAATRLGNADVVLHQVDDDHDGSGGLYDIYVPRSYAFSLWHWLHEASVEFGLAVSIG